VLAFALEWWLLFALAFSLTVFFAARWWARRQFRRHPPASHDLQPRERRSSLIVRVFGYTLLRLSYSLLPRFAHRCFSHLGSRLVRSLFSARARPLARIVPTNVSRSALSAFAWISTLLSSALFTFTSTLERFFRSCVAAALHVFVREMTVGYYLFRRCPENRRGGITPGVPTEVATAR
jgi:hypothetical protein